MEQNTIAFIWDFDKTLIAGYMQDPIFEKYGVDGKAFWDEVNALPEQYEKQGIRVNKDTIYLNHMITCVQQGLFPGLNNSILKELGAKLQFYKGVEEVLSDLKSEIAGNEKYATYGIHVEHYIVSTGLTAMIRGSSIMGLIDGIWGCEFIENPIESTIAPNPLKKNDPVIHQPGYFIDNTSKTRAVFEINKGVNKHTYINVNSKMEAKDRRVPFDHMVYIADGSSDVPVFSVLKQYGGSTFAVYPKGDMKAFNQVDSLRKDGRVDMYAEADYSKGNTAYMWLMSRAKAIADSIYEERENELKNAVGRVPTHLV